MTLFDYPVTLDTIHAMFFASFALIGLAQAILILHPKES
jgi:hypothetical protein